MKKLLITLAIAAAVILAAAMIVPIAFRGRIEEIVKREANAALNARLDFKNLNISLLRHFPHASVELKGLILTGNAPFEGDTLATAERISVVVDILSLFGDGGFEVTKLIFAHPELHARKLADGRVNWDIVKPSAETPDEKSDGTGQTSDFRLSVREFRIQDAALSYADDSTGMRFSANPADLRLRGDFSDAETAVDLRLTVDGIRLVSGGITLLHETRADLDAVIRADLQRKRFAFEHNTLRMNAIELSLDGWAQLRDDALELDITAGCGKVDFKDMLSMIPVFYTRNFKSLAASGQLALAFRAKGEFRGNLLPAFDLSAEVRDGSFQYSSLPQAVTGIRLTAKVSNPGETMDKTVVDLSEFGFSMAGNKVAASLYATTLASDPYFRAAVNGRFDLSDIRQVYPLEKGEKLSGVITANLKVAGRMSDIEHKRYRQFDAEGRFVVEELAARLKGVPELHIRRAAATITPSTLTLGDFGVTFGRSDLAANGQLTDYLGYLLHGDMLSGRLYVKSDLLDINSLMTVLPSGSEETEPQTAMSPVKAPAVPGNLNLSLNTELHKVLFEKTTITDITGEAAVSSGTLSLNRLHLKVFGGTATASGSYSTAADATRPSLRLDMGITNASFAKTFEELETVQKLVPLFEKTGGDYSMTLALNTRLDPTMSPDLKTLNASGEIRSANIRIQHIEAFDALAKVLGNDALRTIEAKDVSIRFTIRDGRITTQPFDLRMGDIAVRMSGTTGLDQSIDYTARISLPANATGGMLTAVNVGIGGTFSSPKITLGLKEAAHEAVNNLVNEQLQKITGSDNLGEELQKQAERLRKEAQNAGERLIEAAKTQRQKLIDGAKNPLGRLAAEKAGDKLVEAAEKQAANLNAEAEKQISKLTAKTE